MRYRLHTERLARLLAASRISQNHWALRLGLSRGHWSDIVNGKHPYLSAKTRERMTEVFSVSDLFTAEPSSRGPDVDFRIAVSGRYELASELGQGGMGTVYLATDLALGRLVALKVVSAEAAGGVGAEHLLKEIAHVSRLQHPHILPLHDAGLGAGSPFYVMPFVRGGSLGARLRERGALPLAHVVRLVRGTAAGLAHAHEHRVLHCDIKPENILLDGEHAYVMDFGIARTLHTEADEWTGIRKELDFSAGTPAYVSPEQAAGDRTIDERSDVYSLACVVYEMLAGRPPFPGDNTQEVVSLRFREPPAPLQRFAPDVPRAVVRVIQQAMSLEPAQRPEGAVEFAKALETAARTASPARAAFWQAVRGRRRQLGALVGLRPTRATRSHGVTRWIESLTRDVAYAVRQRRRSPTLTAVSLLTLALATGLTTSVWAVVDSVLLRPLPFAAADRLVALQSVDSLGNPFSRLSSSNWHDLKRGNRTLDGAAIMRSGRTSVAAQNDAMRVNYALVSPEFFTVLGSRFVLGAGFDSAAVAGGTGDAVISERLWRQNLGASRAPDLVMMVDGRQMPVIGVVADGQEHPAGTDVWNATLPRHTGGNARNNINWSAIARLKQGVSLEQARDDLSTIARQIRETDPVALYAYGTGVIPLRQELFGDATSLVLLLCASVGIVLLIACANLASANLAQGAYRQREMAVRSALGADARRLVRQVFVENALLAFAGGALGVGVAWVLVRSTQVLGAAELPDAARIAIDARVLAGAFAVSALATLLTGVLPALQASRASPNDVIGGSARGTVFGGRGLPGRVLVGAEIAMALMLVAGAGLLVQSFRTVLSRPLGIETANIVTAEVTLGRSYQSDSSATYAYWERALGALRVRSGVTGAALAMSVPLVSGGTGFVDIEGTHGPNEGAGYRPVSDDYFDVLGMRLLTGRSFEPQDARGTLRVAVINSRMAAMYWPGESPLGRRVRTSSMEPPPLGREAEWITVIGVVNDVRHYGYEGESRPEMFVLYRQLPAWQLTALTALVRGRSAGAAVVGSVREALASVDRMVPADIALLDDAARRVTAERRFAMRALQVFAALAVLLAAIGVYGVMSFSVAQRTREMAVRSALGADRAGLLRLVIGSGAVVVGAGVLLGVAGAIASGRVIEAMLYEVSPRDPAVIAAASLLIVVVGLAAAFVPARRATSVDPMQVLRQD